MDAEPVAFDSMTQRRVFDYIRGAYDLGYNDARNARAVPEDSAPGYQGRNVEVDHGEALLHALKNTRPAPAASVESVASVHIKGGCLIGSQRKSGADFPDGQYGLYPIGTYPSPAVVQPQGWLHAIDEAMICSHLGVANESDTYEDAKKKLNTLICWHVDVATDPTVNGGQRLYPDALVRQLVEAAEEVKAHAKAIGQGLMYTAKRAGKVSAMFQRLDDALAAAKDAGL